MDDELKEQIKEYLKENLQIEIEQKREHYSDSYYYHVNLILEDEIISTSYT